MSIATILLPDFTLILLGLLLRRFTRWGDEAWAGMERMVYFVLFPALLFYSTSRMPLDFGATGRLLEGGLLVLLGGVLLGWVAKALFNSSHKDFASGVQTAFRFNSYIGLALASRLGGSEGLALMAVIVGCTVPLCNVAAVWALARHGQAALWKELVRNPLILATAGGLATNLMGLHAPEVVGMTLSRLGSASTALGLMTVGAGLQMSGATGTAGPVAWWTGVKLVAMPCVAWLAGRHLPLTALQYQIVVLYASLPTASSAYILAVRMGGNGPMVAATISLMTVAAIVTTPLWLALVG
jgi:predicted permease